MRMLPVLVSAAIAGSLAGITPASATVVFDFATGTGFVDAEDLRQGFDWDEARLAHKASRIEFENSKLVEETWSVTCDAGAKPFPAIRTQQGAKDFLLSTPTYAADRTTLTGFRITGTRAAISSTTAPFDPGTPCPEPSRGTTVHTARLVSTTTTRTLLAVAGDNETALLQTRSGPPTS
ncbi:hypothetical protein [Actinoplanes sp. G11-F43]|uniref:hypothetical protein n=1 Tax=Actinoplanes sp. G11-F43 TaxID=3424130 RepID=UPI003D3482F0